MLKFVEKQCLIYILCSLEARTIETTATHNVLGFHALLWSVAAEAAAALLYTLPVPVGLPPNDHS